MMRGKAGLSLVLVLVVLFLMVAPAQLAHPSGSMVAPPGTLASSTHGLALGLRTAASPTPALSFPRTVLVETVTGVWCIHCPAESQALYVVDHTMSTSVVSIAELHVCALAPPNCLENYVPPDGTSTLREAFYPTCGGVPDVRFDGGQDSCGASNSESQMQTQYQDDIANASAVPATVGITQNALVSSGTVVLHANITSAVNGTYNAVSYLLEYIGKRNVSNGYGPHDIGNVVRESLANHPITLATGQTTELDATRALNSGWVAQNLSVITFVQLNSTKAVQNTNFAPVATLSTGVVATPASLPAENNTTIALRVTSGLTGAPITGAAILLSSNGGGTLTPASGVSAADGSFSAVFTAPKVTSTETIQLTAQVTAAGYTGGSTTANIVVTPLVAPSVPRGLSVAPAVLQVSLSWLAPASGGGGVTYTLERSTTDTGAYTAVDVSASTQFLDTAVTAGQSYWYKVDARGPGGFSANTTPVSASSVAAVSQGLAANIGWWLTIGSMTFNSTTSASLALYLGDGYYPYQYGSASYAYGAVSPIGSVTVSGATTSFDATFSPRWATLEGTVTPAGAALTLNGTAVTVTDGSYLVLRAAGTYALQATASGYTAQNLTVVLTPGNTTNKSVELQQVSSGAGSQGSTLGGLTGVEALGILAAVGVAVVVGAIVVSSKRGHRGSPPRSGMKNPMESSEAPDEPA
ncbi:MAG: hypothetical protein L3K11_03595 [Thermoplasmata archaeon]|nr:hypothetical protein [Thermoplasmata archaeon]